MPKGCCVIRLCLARFSRSRPLVDLIPTGRGVVRRFHGGGSAPLCLVRGMSSIMSRNAALAAASRSASNLIVIQAPGVSARSDLRDGRSERTWNSNAARSARPQLRSSMGARGHITGGLQLNYSLHPRRPATASRAKLHATVGRQLSHLYQLIPTDEVRVGQAGTCRTFDPL